AVMGGVGFTTTNSIAANASSASTSAPDVGKTNTSRVFCGRRSGDTSGLCEGTRLCAYLIAAWAMDERRTTPHWALRAFLSLSERIRVRAIDPSVLITRA